MQHVEDLPSLGQRAEQRVVAALALPLLVVARRGSFGPATGPQHRSVEVQRQPPQPERHQPLQHQSPDRAAQVLRASCISLHQGAADRGHIRQAAQSQHPLHHRIVAVVPTVTQLPVAQQHVDDELQQDRRLPEDRVHGQMAEAGPQALPERQPGEQRLQHDQAGERGQALILEPQGGNCVGLPVGLGSAILHRGWPPWAFDCLVTSNSTRGGHHFELPISPT